MHLTDRLRAAVIVKEAGFWNWADNIASFVPVVGSLKDAGKGIYHGATGQWGKALGDFAWAGAGLIPGGSFARGGAKLFGAGTRAAMLAGHGLRGAAMAGLGTAGEMAGNALQPQPQPQAPIAPPVAPQPTQWNSPMGPGFNMPSQPQFGFPQPTSFQAPAGPRLGDYNGLLRSFAGNGFGTA